MQNPHGGPIPRITQDRWNLSGRNGWRQVTSCLDSLVTLTDVRPIRHRKQLRIGDVSLVWLT